MRTTVLGILSLTCVLLQAQDGILINEIQPANRSIREGAGNATPDWVELHNGGIDSVDLYGYRLAIAGAYHLIDQHMKVAPQGFMVLWCSGQPDMGTDHVGFALSRHGGTLLLIDPDATTIRDVFTWPEMPSDQSIGRLPDGGTDWSRFGRASPGASNDERNRIGRAMEPIRFAPGPGVYSGKLVVRMESPEGGEIRYTLDGSSPGPDRGVVYQGPIFIDRNTVIRAMNYGVNHREGAEQCAHFIISEVPRPGISMVMDPEDLRGDSGIYVPGQHANNTRTGMDWERRAMVSFPDDPARNFPIGARISGSGSRGSAKRSFKLIARDRYSSPMEGLPFADGAHFKEGILRADAAPNAFLRNSFIERVVIDHGLAVDIQPSTPLPLYLNDRYWGLYRWMPPKDADWIRSITGEQALDVLEGPSAVALSGTDRYFRTALDALHSELPMNRIEALIDLDALMDLACLDLWMGRADHDINVRCYRPSRPGGRWRWVLFDMDLWAPVNENSLARMCSTTVPEAPYMPALMQHPELQERLLARMSALLATALETGHAASIVDAIYAGSLTDLDADHRRWELELDSPAPDVMLNEMRAFITDRPGHLVKHLAKHTGRRTGVIQVDGPPAASGLIRCEGMPLREGRNNIVCFSGVTMEFEAVPAPGMEFAGWEGSNERSAVLRTDMSASRALNARFRTIVP